MNQLLPLPKPPPAPQGTLVLTPIYAISALATGLVVDVKAAPARRNLGLGC